MSDPDIPLDNPDLDALDEFLMSDRAPPDRMGLSDLDGFLTGIAIGPELILPNEWLPAVWGGGAPEFADAAEAATVLGAIMDRYNDILAMRLDSWRELFESKHGRVLMLPILALCGDAEGKSLLGIEPEDEEKIMAEAEKAIPISVVAIAAYWREKRTRPTPPETVRSRPKKRGKRNVRSPARRRR